MLKFNNNEVQGVNFNGNKVNTIRINGVEVWNLATLKTKKTKQERK